MEAFPATAGRLRLRAPVAIDARRVAGNVALGGLVLTGLLIAAGVAAEPSLFVPGRKGGYPGWLHEPLSSLDIGIGPRGVVFTLLAMWVFYGIALACSGALGRRRVIGVIVALHAIFLIGPPLLSTDVFNYIEYGRLGVLHGLNPYTHSPSAAPGDAAYPFIGWRSATSVYGPVFTLASYGTAPLGVGGALWAMKALTVGASLGTVALVWKAAERLGRRPLEAAMFFGLNPLLLVYAVGGVHNDVLMMALAVGAIVLAVEGRERASGLVAVGAAAIKASSGILLPYLLVGSRHRPRFLLGVLAGVAAAGALWAIVFGLQIGPMFDTLRWEQHHGSLHSVPKALGGLFGFPVGDPAVRHVAQALLAGAVAFTLWRAHRTGEWLVAAGWGTVAVLVTTAWLLPWYVVWVLPIAAIAGDRRLRIATLALMVFVIAMRTPYWMGWGA
jgi:hypothetical protein